MNKKIKTEAVDHLFDAILSLQSKEECYAFFEDLCTVNELLSLSQVQVSRLEKKALPRQPFLKLRQRRLRAGFLQNDRSFRTRFGTVSPAGARGGILRQDLVSDPVNTVMHTFCLHCMSKKERRLRKTFSGVSAKRVIWKLAERAFYCCCCFQNDQRSSAFFANSVLTSSSYATRFVSSPPSSRISCSRINASSEKIRSFFHVSCST